MRVSDPCPLTGRAIGGLFFFFWPWCRLLRHSNTLTNSQEFFKRPLTGRDPPRKPDFSQGPHPVNGPPKKTRLFSEDPIRKGPPEKLLNFAQLLVYRREGGWDMGVGL